jgi:hypothetical protein
MTIKMSYSSYVACVVECASLPRRSSAKAGRPAARHSAFARRRLTLVRSAFAPLPFRALALKKVGIAKRTQFHSKHIVLQILTTKKFLYSPKANLMILHGVPGSLGRFTTSHVAAEWFPVASQPLSPRGSSVCGTKAGQRFNLSTFLPRRSVAKAGQRSGLPEGKLTLTTKLTLKSKRTNTKSDHYFDHTGLKLIHWHANPLIHQSMNPGSGCYSSLLKPILTIIFLFCRLRALAPLR